MSDIKVDLLPKSWAIATLPNIVCWDGLLSDGDWVESKDQDPNGMVRLIQLADIGDGKYQNKSSRFLTTEKAKKLNCTYLEKGDLLIARMPDPLGRACIFPGDEKNSVTVVDICILRSGKQGINHRWLMSVINSPEFRQQILCRASGTTRQRISKKNISEMLIPIPPLNEQHRIVAKIEALKARSQRAKEALEAIPPLLDQFRQSVLAAAFRGDLTADWREKNPDVEPASVLLERIKEEIPEPKNKNQNSELPDPFRLPNEWKWVSLASICRSITDGDHQPPPKADKGVPFLVISNISNGKLDFSNIRYVPEEYYHSIQRHRKAEKGDLIYSVVGSYGIPVLIDTEERFCFQRHIALLKPSYLISSKYLLYALKSDFLFRQATEVATGTTQLTVTLSGLRRIKVPLVSLAEQKEIVERVETVLKIAERVEVNYQGIKAHVNQLDQSILAKAFRGELVPQDPNDEPASVLLERIRAERAKREAEAKVAKKSTGKTTVQRGRKAKQQDSESIQLGLPGVE